MAGRPGAGAFSAVHHPHPHGAGHQLPHVVSVLARICARIWHYVDSSGIVDDGADDAGRTGPVFRQ